MGASLDIDALLWYLAASFQTGHDTFAALVTAICRLFGGSGATGVFWMVVLRPF
jgi:hypothetical protein